MSENKILVGLMTLYLISLGFQSLLDLPVVGHRLQISEFVFVLIGLYSILNYRYFSFSFDRIDYVILLYLGLNLVSSVWNESELSSYLETLGRFYLFGVYFLFKTIISQWEISKLKKYVIDNFYFLGMISSIVALVGWMIAISTNENNLLATSYENYPYFGTIYRIRGATPTPTMFAVLLSFSAFFLTILVIEKKSKGIRDLICLIVILITCFLSFSKTFLLIVSGIGLIFLREKGLFKKYNLLEPILIFSISILFIVSSHFLFFKSDSDWNKKLETTPFSTNEILFENDKIIVLESFYIFSKRCAIEISKINPILGVGPGNFNQAMYKLDRNEFPALNKLMGVDPHSVYFGTLAENGILGLICVMLMFYFILVKLRNTHIEESSFVYALFMIFVLLLIEGITTDIMNFRNLWIIMGIVAGIKSKS
jgi:O-antigen ligase